LLLEGLFSCGQTAGLCFSLDAHFSENGGSIKVRSYTSEKSGKKLDYFGEEPSSVLHESLLATVVLYLSNTTQGGELLFPNSEVSLISNLRGKKMTLIWHTTMNVEFSFFSR